MAELTDADIAALRDYYDTGWGNRDNRVARLLDEVERLRARVAGAGGPDQGDPAAWGFLGIDSGRVFTALPIDAPMPSWEHGGRVPLYRAPGAVAAAPTEDEDVAVRWRACADDTIGGWCLVREDGPATPAVGAREVASFASESVARRIAHLHNAALGGTPVGEAVAWSWVAHDDTKVTVDADLANRVAALGVDVRPLGYTVPPALSAGEDEAAVERALREVEQWEVMEPLEQPNGQWHEQTRTEVRVMLRTALAAARGPRTPDPSPGGES